MMARRIAPVLLIICVTAFVIGLVRVFSAVDTSAKTTNVATNQQPQLVKPLPKPVLSDGHVIYVRTLDKSEQGPADVMERNLATGKERQLISHNIFPVAEVRSMVVSPDGNHVFFELLDDYSLRYRIWSRQTGRLTQFEPDKDSSPQEWSSSGRYLLAMSSSTSAKSGYSIDCYDTSTGEYRALGRFPYYPSATWVPGDKTVIVVDGPEEEGSSVYLQPADGRAKRVLLRWKRPIHSMFPLPDGSGYAFADASGVYCLGKGAKQARNLRISNEADLTGADFAYNRRTHKLAILAMSVYGNPHVALTQSLWLVDVKKGKSTKLTEWYENYLSVGEGSGSYTRRRLKGWLPDGKSVLISEHTTTGENTDLSTHRSDWFELYSYDTTRPKEAGKKVFSCRYGCLEMDWWLGSSRNKH